jgi:hypothetical protein
MTDLDADVKELLIDDLRERAKERAEGRTLARLFDELANVRVDLHDINSRADRHSERIAKFEVSPSGRPPAARHRLDSVAQVRPTDAPAVQSFKVEELAPLVATLRAGRLFWRALGAVVLLLAGVAAIYSAVRESRATSTVQTK